MRKHPISVIAVLALAFLGTAFASPVSLSSPDGALKVSVTDASGRIRYSVSLGGKEVLGPSVVGIKSDGISFGVEGTLGDPSFGTVDETYPFLGAKSVATNHANLATVPVTTRGHHYSLDLHVADDGVGVRLRLPARKGRQIEADLSTWQLPGDPTLWVMDHSDCYEQAYRATTLSGLGTNRYGLPLTTKEGNIYVTLSEAALTDYGDMEVTRSGDGTLVGSLPHDASGWKTDNEVIQPWRVAIVTPSLTRLVNTTLIQNLNPPPDDPSLLKADWIKPGRSTWQWLNSGAPKFEEQHQWVDWTKSLGYEYYLVDEGWKKWPDNWDSLKSVCDYAKTRGIKVWLWVHSNEVKDPIRRREYFSKASEAGIAGIKMDFPRAPDRSWNTWYHDAAKDAAASTLMVNFHGAVKPTGMERTWPNEISREGIRGHEWHTARHRWVPERILEPQHDVILPFTRLVVGHGDYTPTVLESAEIHGNTYPHELAQAIVFNSPFLCMGGNPRKFLESPARDLIAAFHPVWDETIVLPGTEPGKIAAFARRHGDQWFVGVLNGADPANLTIPLSFLGQGSWKASSFGDVEGKGDSFKRRESIVTASTSLQANLLPRGGYVLWIRR
jgi:alpha-glucosidase